MYLLYPQFNYIKVGYKGVYITERCYPGPSFSKLMMSLVNNLLKFQMAILQKHCYFLLKKNVRILRNAKDSHI